MLYDDIKYIYHRAVTQLSQTAVLVRNSEACKAVTEETLLYVAFKTTQHFSTLPKQIPADSPINLISIIISHNKVLRARLQAASLTSEQLLTQVGSPV